MFDPLIDVLKSAWAWLAALPGRLLRAIGRFFTPGPKLRPDGTPRRHRYLRWAAKMLVFVVVFLYLAPLVWHASWIRGYDLGFPAAILSDEALEPANDSTVVQQGTTGTRTCGRSQIVDMQVGLIDFLVNQNAWVAAMPQYKLGFFGIPWQATPFLDNKEAFQHGVLFAVRRTAVELSDQIGRVRGTSEADLDLQNARGSLQYDSEIWWINPFDPARPFGPVQPASRVYRNAITLYDRYNERLEQCQAVLDARADNLRSFLDRVSNDLGSAADGLAKRSLGSRYDPVRDEYVSGEGNDRGWFDFRADNVFYDSSGLMYAYHGIMQAARRDFSDVIQTRNLGDIWNRMERNIAEAAALGPFIVANGRRDGFLIPDHLAVMSENVLRARANMTEISDILDR
jgi:hypothetical protein